MSNQVVKMKREAIAACMTCPLCNKLFRDATTISECLHTFCRKCIYKKLSDEEVDCCPICNIDLGCVPLEKLRPDHNLQDVRAKIFPYKRRKVQAPEIPPSITSPVRRKERSLSSLVVSTPRVSAQSGMTGRRTKSIARKLLRGSGFSIDKPVKKEEVSAAEEHPESSGSPETLNKVTQNIRQVNSSNGDPSSHSITGNDSSNAAETWEGKVDLWEPLTCLVEVANRSKSSKFTSQQSGNKAEALHSGDHEGPGHKTKGREHGQKSKAHDEKNRAEFSFPESDRPKKSRKIRQKKPASAFGDINVSTQALLDNVTAKSEKRINPIWFSLVAINDLKGDASLPQIPPSYLRIKDGNLTISSIQKYLMRKLNLPNEDEVEIRCMGQTLVPTLPLNELVGLWSQNTLSEKLPAITGSSAKDFVMVLAYGRKIPVS